MSAMQKRIALGALGCVASCLIGCETLTREEAAEALAELEVSSQASALTSSSVEISTNFTIGDAAEAAAAELRTFVESQLPCAEITREGPTLTVEYGAKPGNCTYKGLTYEGAHKITVMRNDMDDVLVDHEWIDFRNDVVEVTGTAAVTWSLDDRTRHVSYEQTWTRRSDGRSGVGTGEVTATALDAGILEGFTVDGERDWTGKAGEWDLDIDGVEMRWVDPVPQAGKYTLDTPFDKRITMAFERQTATQILVTVQGPRRKFEFKVATLPGE
jgi:hypothetical protein